MRWRGFIALAGISLLTIASSTPIELAEQGVCSSITTVYYQPTITAQPAAVHVSQYFGSNTVITINPQVTITIDNAPTTFTTQVTYTEYISTVLIANTNGAIISTSTATSIAAAGETFVAGSPLITSATGLVTSNSPAVTATSTASAVTPNPTNIVTTS